MKHSNFDSKSLEKTIHSLSRVEWMDFWFSAKKRKEIFEEELKEFDEIFNKINMFSKYSFTLDKEGLEASLEYIKIVIIKSVAVYIEEKYGLNLQLKCPNLEKKWSFKKVKVPYAKNILLELKSKK